MHKALAVAAALVVLWGLAALLHFFHHFRQNCTQNHFPGSELDATIDPEVSASTELPRQWPKDDYGVPIAPAVDMVGTTHGKCYYTGGAGIGGGWVERPARVRGMRSVYEPSGGGDDTVVSHTHKIIFLHVLKAGGTAIYDMLWAMTGPHSSGDDWRCQIYEHKTYCDCKWLQINPNNHLGIVPLVCRDDWQSSECLSHIKNSSSSATQIEKCSGDRKFSLEQSSDVLARYPNYTIFTAVRNPWDRMRSVMKMAMEEDASLEAAVKRAPPELKQSISLAGVCSNPHVVLPLIDPNLSSDHWLQQVDFIMDKNACAVVDYVARMETLASDMLRFFRFISPELGEKFQRLSQEHGWVRHASGPRPEGGLPDSVGELYSSKQLPDSCFGDVMRHYPADVSLLGYGEPGYAIEQR